MNGDTTLALLGVSEQGERVYRSVVAGRSTSAARVACEFGIPEAESTAELEALRGLGLVNRLAVGEDYSAVDPRFAIRMLADRTAERLNRIRDTVPELASAFDEAQRVGSDASLGRIVSGADEVAGWYNRLEHQAEFEFLAFDRPPYVLATTNPLEMIVLERGVTWRAVYAAASFAEESAFDDVRRLVARGEEARVTAELPVKMAIADRRIALVSLSLSADEPVALVTEAAPMVQALIELFDSHWRRAVPVPLEPEGLPGLAPHQAARLHGTSRPHRTIHPPRQLGPSEHADAMAGPFRAATDAERTLLALFSAGLKDELIARQLGVSARTVRRRSQELLRELGAANRFQAGAEAARRGWI